MNDLNKQIKAARAEAAQAERDYVRLQRRRDEIMARPALNEARRGRFIRRLDEDIAHAHKRLTLAEMNLEGLTNAEGQ